MKTGNSFKVVYSKIYSKNEHPVGCTLTLNNRNPIEFEFKSKGEWDTFRKLSAQVEAAFIFNQTPETVNCGL